MRRLTLLTVWLALIVGCASTFPEWKPDRCHRGQANRQTLNFDLICVQSP